MFQVNIKITRTSLMSFWFFIINSELIFRLLNIFLNETRSSINIFASTAVPIVLLKQPLVNKFAEICLTSEENGSFMSNYSVYKNVLKLFYEKHSVLYLSKHAFQSCIYFHNATNS